MFNPLEMDSFNGKHALSMEVFQIILDPQWKNHRKGKILKIHEESGKIRGKIPNGQILQGTKVLLVQSSSNFVLQSLVLKSAAADPGGSMD